MDSHENLQNNLKDVIFEFSEASFFYLIYRSILGAKILDTPGNAEIFPPSCRPRRSDYKMFEIFVNATEGRSKKRYFPNTWAKNSLFLRQKTNGQRPEKIVIFS